MSEIFSYPHAMPVDFEDHTSYTFLLATDDADGAGGDDGTARVAALAAIGVRGSQSAAPPEAGRLRSSVLVTRERNDRSLADYVREQRLRLHDRSAEISFSVHVKILLASVGQQRAIVHKVADAVSILVRQVLVHKAGAVVIDPVAHLHRQGRGSGIGIVAVDIRR